MADSIKVVLKATINAKNGNYNYHNLQFFCSDGRESMKIRKITFFEDCMEFGSRWRMLDLT